MKKFEIIFPVLKKCWPVFLVAVGLIELIVLYLFNDSLPLHHKISNRDGVCTLAAYF